LILLIDMNKECEGAKDVERVTPARTEKNKR